MNEKNLKFLVLLIPFVALLCVTDVYSTGNRYGQVFRKVHLDYHLNPWVRGAAAAVTLQEARRQVRLLRQAGVQAVEIFAYDHFGHAFYPSEVVPRHPDLTQDYFGNMSRAARDLGLKVIARKPLQVEVNLMRSEKGYLVSLANSAIQNNLASSSMQRNCLRPRTFMYVCASKMESLKSSCSPKGLPWTSNTRVAS